jgi:hypothetical protein
MHVYHIWYLHLSRLDRRHRRSPTKGLLLTLNPEDDPLEGEWSRACWLGEHWRDCMLKLLLAVITFLWGERWESNAWEVVAVEFPALPPFGLQWTVSPLEGLYQWNMQMLWPITMPSLSGVGKRRSSCNLHSYCCLFSCSLQHWMFVTMIIIVSTTVTKFPFWKEIEPFLLMNNPKLRNAQAFVVPQCKRKKLMRASY